jgi:hypothetical protein
MIGSSLTNNFPRKYHYTHLHITILGTRGSSRNPHSSTVQYGERHHSLYINLYLSISDSADESSKLDVIVIDARLRHTYCHTSKHQIFRVL